MATATRHDNHGEIFTRRWVVDTILDLVGYDSDIDLTDRVLIEPSCGSGAFLGPVVERLLSAAARKEVPHASLTHCIQSFDLQPHNVEISRDLCTTALVEDGCDSELAVKLSNSWVQQADFLLDVEPLHADFVVGNPPYIRIEDLRPATAAEYRRRWSTMSGRADIYVPFIEKSLASLLPGGRLGFICADRWFRNSYGSALRKLVADSYQMQHVWTMHDVDAFASEVSAYPAITVIANDAPTSVTVVDTTNDFGSSSAQKAVTWARSRRKATRGEGFSAYRLPHWFSGEGFWPTGSPRRLALIEHLTERHPRLEDPETGTKVGIGVATGADKAYCIDDPEDVDDGRALPMVAGSDLTSGEFEWGGHYLANVWLQDGRLVDLGEYPKLAAHLEQWGDQLRNRHTAKKNLSNWHRTIDKVNHSLLDTPLLMMRDLGAEMNPVLVPAGYYPHHNVYWVSSTGWDLEVLGGILLSAVSQAFIEAFCVRMRGGTLRFQAQYLRQIRVPDPTSISRNDQATLKQAFRRRDRSLATDTTCRVFGIDPDEFDL